MAARLELVSSLSSRALHCETMCCTAKVQPFSISSTPTLSSHRQKKTLQQHRQTRHPRITSPCRRLSSTLKTPLRGPTCAPANPHEHGRAHHTSHDYTRGVQERNKKCLEGTWHSTRDQQLAQQLDTGLERCHPLFTCARDPRTARYIVSHPARVPRKIRAFRAFGRKCVPTS